MTGVLRAIICIILLTFLTNLKQHLLALIITIIIIINNKFIFVSKYF